MADLRLVIAGLHRATADVYLSDAGLYLTILNLHLVIAGVHLVSINLHRVIAGVHRGAADRIVWDNGMRFARISPVWRFSFNHLFKGDLYELSKN